MEHVHSLFTKEENDSDVRIINSGGLEFQAYLSDMSVCYLANSISEFEPSFYIQQLKKKSPKYHDLTEKSFPLLTLKKMCVLEFGGIPKYKLVDLPKTKYAILALQPLQAKPIDLLYVGIKDKKLHLENLNLSSTNCWTISFYNFLVNSQTQNWELKLGCEPFTPAKALIDLFCGISTIPNPNSAAWCRFLRDCMRSMQAKIEYQMVQNVFQLKPKSLSNGNYIYSLLKQEMHKIKIQAETNKVNPYLLIPFLFRACQSLQAHSFFSNKDCLNVWRLAISNEWFQIEDASCVENNISLALKKAVVDEQIPFSVVCAWMSILAWIYQPLSATSHCQQPVFHLKSPFTCLLPIQPLKNGKILEVYFAKSICPASFQTLYNIMQIHDQTSLVSFPLTSYLSELQIDPIHLKHLAENWLTHSSPLLNVVGLNLYLGIASLFPDKYSLFIIFQRLPKILQQSVHSQQKEKILAALSALAARISLHYQHLIQKIIQQKNLALKSQEWLSLLIQTQDPELLRLAYVLWKEHESLTPRFVQKYSEIGNSLYQALCMNQPHLAISILQTLITNHLSTPISNQLDKVISLLQSYQNHASQQLICDMDRFLPFIYPLFEQEKPLEFKNPLRQQTFSQALAFFIDSLYQISFKQVTADYFLLEASRKRYLDPAWQTHIWLERIENLSSQPRQACYAHCLYRLIYQENLLKNPTLTHLQRVDITLGEALLKDKDEPLSLSLLEQLSKQNIMQRNFLPFYEWALHAFQQQAHHPIEKCHLQTFQILLSAAPIDKQAEIQVEFYHFFQRVVKYLPTLSADLTLYKAFPFTFLDQFLGDKKLCLLMDLAHENWRELLLAYLHIPSNFPQRLPKLWLVYEQLMRLFNKIEKPAPEQLLHLFKLFSNLLEYSLNTSHSPTPLLLKWMELKHKLILNKLCENHCISEAENVLIALNHYHISHSPLAHYIWQVCQQKLSTSSSCSILPLLDLDSFENVCLQIQPSDYLNLPHLLADILTADPMRPTQAWQWLKWCLNLAEKEPVFKHTQLMEACLTCAKQFISTREFLQAFAILIHLSHLSDTQLQTFCTYWVQIATDLSSSSSIDINRQLFLTPPFATIFQAIAEQLKPLVDKFIQRHLTQPFPQQAEKKLALDLITTYVPQQAGSWLSMWKSLDPKQDATFISQLWEMFKIHTDFLIGTPREIAECWTCALNALYHGNHPDLLAYSYLKWLKFFKDPLTLDLKWKALEFIFLRMVQNLSLTSNLDILIHIVEAKNTLPDLELLGEWNRKIDLAIIERLQSCENPDCLLYVSGLLHSWFKLNAQDAKLSSTYLSHFINIVNAYLTIPIPPEWMYTYPFLTVNIQKTISIICSPETTFHPSCVALIKAFCQPHHCLDFNYALNLVSKILNQNSTAIDTLKPSYLSLMKHIAANQVIIIDLNLLQKCLEKAFRLMILSAAEKCHLTHQFLHIKKYYEPSINSADLPKNKLILYTQWSSYLFIDLNFLKMAVNQAAYLTGCHVKMFKDKQAKDTYNECLKQILDVKYQIQLSSTSTYKQGLKEYVELVIHGMQNMDLKHALLPDLLIEALKVYIDNKIQTLPPSESTNSEILLLLNAFFYLYPPNPIIDYDIKTYKISLHLAYCKYFLAKVYEKKIFNLYPDDVITLELWMPATSKSIHFIKQKHEGLLQEALTKFLKYKTKYCVFISIKICYLIQTKCTPVNQLKKLKETYEKILEAIRPHVKDYIIFDNTKSVETLSEFLIQQTLLILPKKKAPHRQHFLNIAQLFFDFYIETVTRLITEPDTAAYQVYYLSKCLFLLKLQANRGAFQNRHSEYFSILKMLLPLVKTISLQKELNYSQKIKLTIPDPTLLFQDWIDLLLFGPHSRNSKDCFVLKASEKKQQRALLFAGLSLLQDKSENDNLVVLCDSFLNALMCIFDSEKLDSPYGLDAHQPDAVKLFESIKQNLLSCNLNAEKKLTLKWVNYQFYKKKENYQSDLANISIMIQELPKLNNIAPDFPFFKISANLLKTILRCSPENRKKYLLEREEFFLFFLSTMRPMFEQNSSSTQAQDLLMLAVEEGIHENLLHNKNPIAVEHFEWAKKWLSQFPSFSSLFKFLGFIFYPYTPSICDNDQQEIYSLLIPLCTVVLQQGKLTYSQWLVHLITILPIDAQAQCDLFVSWLYIFPEVFNRLENSSLNQQAIFTHIQNLIQHVKHLQIFDDMQLNILHNLTPTSISNKNIYTVDYQYLENQIQKNFK